MILPNIFHNPYGSSKEDFPETSLQSSTGEKIALQSVHVEGQIDGLLLSTCIRQNYRNDTGKNLEIVYTFPVGYDTSLLGMDVQIGEKHLKGVVIEKKEAEREYEKAVDDGDTPVMVQESSPGLYTANLGNIKDKETVSVEIHCAQLLRFEQDQIRVKIPTVIAPRYGDPHKEGGLAPHETDRVDMAARYPLTIRLKVTGETAKAGITCPSHKATVNSVEDGISVSLESGAMLDRDFILLLQGLAGRTFALTVPGEEQHTMLASFCPKLPIKTDPMLLKILVDCSGSMCGDSIFQAKNALQSVLKELSSQDFISFSRFGSDVNHTFNVMQQCSPETLGKLTRIVAGTDADMGGTEMENAVQSTCRNVTVPEDVQYRPSVLLITDDLYWNDKGLLKFALESGHRFFTIGVGSASAETLLRKLSEKTGGACEFVTPNENMAAAIVRMFRRMRVAQSNKLCVEWGSVPAWQSSVPVSVFDGETLHLFATFNEAPTQLPKLSWEADGKTEYAIPEIVTVAENQDIAKLAASRRMQTAGRKEALEIALKYQLVSDQTSLFLVYLREGEDKVTELPQVQQVPQMMAMGSHGYGSVKSFVGALNGVVSSCDFSQSVSKYASMGHNIQGYFPSENYLSGMESLIPFPSIPSLSTQSPQELLEHFDKMALVKQDFKNILGMGISWLIASDELKNVIAKLSAQTGISGEDALAVLLDWLMDQLANEFTPTRHSKRLIRSQLRNIDPAQVTALRTLLTQEFPAVSLYSWAA